MRYALCIGGMFIAAAVLSVPDAEAQFSYSGEGECNKGLFWPFVRNPGDCLTDAERRSGMTGTYRGSEIEETDAGGEAAAPAPAPAQAQQSAPTPAAAPPLQPSQASLAQDVTSTAGAVPVPAAPAAASAAVQPAAAQSAAPGVESAAQEPAAAAEDRATYTGPGGCTKGIFWPFVRRPGDCLTDAEVRSGMTGTFQ